MLRKSKYNYDNSKRCGIICFDIIQIVERKIPMILKYMYNDQVCSIIDVDMQNEKVSVTNFTKDILRRAFGENENPTYEDFQLFLEKRCIPRNRDKMKWHLREIGVDYYNPLSIIAKTNGRMAEDHFWIEIEEEKPYLHEEERE